MERNYIIETNVFQYPFVGAGHYEHYEVAHSDTLEHATELVNAMFASNVQLLHATKQNARSVMASDRTGSTDDYYQICQSFLCDDGIVIIGVRAIHRPEQKVIVEQEVTDHA